MNPDLEDLTHCSGRLLAKKAKQNKHNILMIFLVTKN
jgi:hypothetical protein